MGAVLLVVVMVLGIMVVLGLWVATIVLFANKEDDAELRLEFSHKATVQDGIVSEASVDETGVSLDFSAVSPNGVQQTRQTFMAPVINAVVATMAQSW